MPAETEKERSERILQEAHSAFWSRNPHAHELLRSRQSMPHVNQMLRSKYLGKQDLPQPVIAHVRGVAMEQARNGEDPGWLMYFSELRKPLKLNNTILKYLAEMLGPNSESWVGIKCKVYVDHSVQFGGQMVGGVRVQVAISSRRNPAEVGQQMYAGAGGVQPPGSGGPVFAGNANIAQPTAGAGAPAAQSPGNLHPGQPAQQQPPGGMWPGYASQQQPMSGAPGPGAPVDISTGEFRAGVDPDFDDDIPF